MLSFTADTRETWARFAEKIGAEHICRGQASRNDDDDSVIYDHKGTLITLDFVSDIKAEEASSQTRIYAPLSAKETFRFNIYPSNFVERVVSFVGGQDINIGDELFDRKFIVKTNDVEKVRLFLANPKIRELIWGVLPNGLFSPTFQADWKKGETDYLSVNEPGVINSVERLELIFQLMIESFEQLVRLGLVSSSL